MRVAPDGWRRWRWILAAVLAVPLLAAPASGEQGSRAEPELRVGNEAIPAARAAIDAAETSLAAVLYKFDEPSLLASVERALSRGVRVRILADGAQAKRKRSLVGLAERAGADVRLWRPKLGKLHAKLMVIDERRAIAGSFNWTRSAARSNVELLLDFQEPDTVKRLSGVFEALWDRADR